MNELCYKEACEEEAGTKVLNNDEIFMKLSSAVCNLASEIEGYASEKDGLTVEVNEIDRKNKKGLLVDIEGGSNRLLVEYTIEDIDDSPSSSNSVYLELNVNGEKLESYIIEHTNGEYEVIDGIASPITDECISYDKSDRFINIVTEYIDREFV